MPGLDRERVVKTALLVLGRVGFEGLTMRALAKRLHVENPALYWHFKNKQQIIDAMAEQILERAIVPPRPRERWRPWLRRSARAFRAALLSHRDGPRVVAEADLAASEWTRQHAVAQAFLRRHGFTPRRALVATVTLADFTLGATWEQESDPRKERRGRDEMFEAGVDVILRGLKRR